MCKAGQTATDRGVRLQKQHTRSRYELCACPSHRSHRPVVSPQLGSAQELSRYRAYILESSLESVISVSGARAADVKTLHERPAKIQELEWRARTSGPGPNWPIPWEERPFPSATTACIKSSSATITNGRTA